MLIDSCIIVAESKEQVEESCECNFIKYEEWDINRIHPIVLYDRKNLLSEDFDIHDGQKWTIMEVDINEIKQHIRNFERELKLLGSIK